jgi:hypothetical protein
MARGCWVQRMIDRYKAEDIERAAGLSLGAAMKRHLGSGGGHGLDDVPQEALGARDRVGSEPDAYWRIQWANFRL